ncbi:MAG: methyltransferase type 11 [Cycloclasticus sp. symbiont of Poecilosclerida sp. M]|nr:MAG: methyltransferase type 11 [Cycloclasticus sp. symbiont of Poecilosclerida sp. M]
MRDKNTSVDVGPKGLRHWFRTPIGEVYRHAESMILSAVLRENFRKEVLQIDLIGWEGEFHEAMRFAHYTILDADAPEESEYARVTGTPDEIPIDTHSIDIVILPHTLEFESDPHQVLREVNRVLKPEGIVLLLGFNPWAFWHIPRFFPKAKERTPWHGRFISRYRVVDWLKLLNIEIEVSKGFCLLPIVKSSPDNKVKSLLGKAMAWLPFLSAAYFIMGVKRTTKGTPAFHLNDLKERFISPLSNPEPAKKSLHEKGKHANLH